MGSGTSKAASANFTFINDRHTQNARRLEAENLRAERKLRDMGTQGRRERQVLENMLEAYSEVTDLDKTEKTDQTARAVSEELTEDEEEPEPSQVPQQRRVTVSEALVVEEPLLRSLPQSSDQPKPLAARRRTADSRAFQERAERAPRRASSSIANLSDESLPTRASSGHAASPKTSLAELRKEKHLRKVQRKMAARSDSRYSGGSQVFSTPFGKLSVYNGRAQGISPNAQGRRHAPVLHRRRSMETLLELDAQLRPADPIKVSESDSTPVQHQGKRRSYATTARALRAVLSTGQSVPKGDEWTIPDQKVSPGSLSSPKSFESRGVTVSWLLQFYDYCEKSSGSIELTAEDVAETIIDPAIETHGCPISYLPGVETGDPSVVVVYAPDRPLREMVACLRHTFKRNLDTVVWIDLFAVDRSMSDMHDDPLSHMQCLPRVIQSVPRVMMVLDPEGSCFGTPWCLLAAFLGAQDLSSSKEGKLRILTDSIEQQQARAAGEALAQASIVEALEEAGAPEALDDLDCCPDGDTIDSELPGLLSQAIQILDFLPVTDPEAPGGLQIATAALTRSSVLKAAGDIEGAQSLLELVLEVRVKQFGGTHMKVASAHNSLANVLRSVGEYAKAEPHYHKALFIMDTLLGHDAPGLSTPLFNLAELLHSQGKYEEAEPLFRRCLRLTEEGSDDETMCLAYKYVSHIKKLRGDLSGAQEMLSAAMEIKEKKGPSKDSMMLALLFAQGSVARDLGNHIEAALLFKRVADAKEEQKPGSLGTGTVLHALGDAYTAAGDYESAEISYRRSLAILKKHKREDDPDVTAEMKSLMNTLHLKGEHREADLIKTRLREINGSISRRLLTVTSKSLETEDEDEEEERSAAVLEMAAAGRAAQAEHEQRKRLANARSECGPNSLPVANAALLLALILAQRKRFSEAKQLQRTALGIREAKLDSNHTDVLLLRSSLGQTMEVLGEYREAEQLYFGLMGQLESLYGPQSPELQSIQIRHSATLMAQGKHQEALPSCDNILSLHKSRLDADDARIPRSLDRAAMAFSGAGLASEAVEHFKAALAWREAHLHGNHPEIASSEARLGGVLLALGKADEAELHCHRAVQSSRRSGPSMRKHVALHLRCLAAVQSSPEGRQETLDIAASIEDELLAEVSHQLECDMAQVEESIKQEDLGAAEASSLSALAAAQAALGPRHAAVIEPLRNLVDILDAQGRPDDARIYAKELSAARAFQEGSGDPFSALPGIDPLDVDSGLSRAVRGGRFVDGSTYALSQFSGSSKPPTTDLTAETSVSSVVLSKPMQNEEFEVEIESLEMAGNLSGAVELCMTQAERLAAAFGQGHAETGPVLSRLAELLLRQGSVAEAQAACSKAAVVFRDTAGAESAEMAACLTLMARVMRAAGNDEASTMVMEQAKTIKSAIAGPAHAEGAPAAAPERVPDKSISSGALDSWRDRGVVEPELRSSSSVLGSSGSAAQLPEPQESDAQETGDVPSGQEEEEEEEEEAAPLNHSWLHQPRPPVNPPTDMTDFVQSVMPSPSPRVTFAPPQASLRAVRPPSAVSRGSFPPPGAAEQAPERQSRRRRTVGDVSGEPCTSPTAGRPPSSGDRPPSGVRRRVSVAGNESELAPVRPPSAMQRSRASDGAPRLQSYHKVSEAANSNGRVEYRGSPAHHDQARVAAVEQAPEPLSRRRFTADDLRKCAQQSAELSISRPPSGASRRVSLAGNETELAPVRPPSAMQRSRASDGAPRLHQNYLQAPEAPDINARVDYHGSAAQQDYDQGSAGMRGPCFHDSAQAPGGPRAYRRSYSDAAPAASRSPFFLDSASPAVPRNQVNLNNYFDDGPRDFGVEPNGVMPSAARGKEGRAIGFADRAPPAPAGGGQNPRFLQPADANVLHHHQVNSDSHSNPLRPTNIARHSANYGLAKQKMMMAGKR